MVDHQLYRRNRTASLTKAGMDPRAINYIIDLELRTTLAAVPSLADLTNQPKWEGKRVYLTGSGRHLLWIRNRWRLL